MQQHLYTKQQFCKFLDVIEDRVKKSGIDDLVFHSRLILEDMGVTNKDGLFILIKFLRDLSGVFPEQGIVNFRFDTMPFQESLNNLQMQYDDEVRNELQIKG